MNILFLSRLFSPHVGGVEKHVLKLSELLIEKGHKVTVVTEKHLPELKTQENIEGIEIFRIPNLKENRAKKFKIWGWLWNNRQLIQNADVTHCHDVFFWYLPFCFLYPFKKVFTTFHGYESYPLEPKNILMHKISEKLSMGNICIGDFIKKWYGTKPTYVSYGAVDISDKKKVVNNKQDDHSAVFIGRLDEQTGFLTYLEAFKKIKRRISDFKLTVFGDGKFKNYEKGVEFKGFVNNAEKEIGKYNFAFVSRYLSILEAMAAKRLVFAVYDNPLKEDYLKMSPFSECIIILNSPSELVSKIIYYLDNPQAKEKLINQAYVLVKKQTWENMTDTYLKLWNKIL